MNAKDPRANEPRSIDERITDDALFFQIHQLVTAILEDPGCPEAGSLRELLSTGGPEVRRHYAIYIEETEALRSSSVGVGLDGPDVSPGVAPRDRARQPGALRWTAGVLSFAALAACLILSVTLGPLGQRTEGDGVVASAAAHEPAGVATVTRLIAVQWEDDAQAFDEMSRLACGDRIRIKRGQVEVVFDTGVELVAAGHVDAEIESPTRLLGRLGAFSARVGERGKGFIIDTPTTRVVDLGTEFGVVIDDAGDTEVAVFKGKVDLDALPNSPAVCPTGTLGQGEAVRIDHDGNQSRLVSITSERFPIAGRRLNPRSGKLPLLGSVRDNLRDPNNKKFYQLVRSGLYEDVPAFVDREYEWNGVDDEGLPGFLVGAEYLMPFNDDKVQPDFELTVSLSAPASVFVFYSNRMPVPDWLAEAFRDTGKNLGLDRQARTPSSRKRLGIGAGESIDETFSVWRRDCLSPCEVTMGNAAQPLDGEDGWNMYAVAATPLAASVVSD